jgi:AAA ATPase domain
MDSQLIISCKLIGWSQQQSVLQKLVRPSALVFSCGSSCRTLAVDLHLDRLPGAALHSVEFDEQKACLPGTRKELLKAIEEWIHDSGDGCERLLWLSGPAGTGKSSVANSVAERMDSLGRLAASFRFDRGQAERTPDVLIGNLCRQVARFDKSLEGAILEAVKRHGPGGSMPCRSQATKLFVGPISKIEMVGPVVIVIDALDESGNDEYVQGVQVAKIWCGRSSRSLSICLPPLR